MSNEVLVHDIERNSERVARFWDNFSQRGEYFSEIVGDSLIRCVEKSIGRPKGRVLDYGCGPGNLLQKLLRRGIPCEGADTSPASLTEAQQRLGADSRLRGLTLLKGFPSSFAENSFDVVFFVETIEHILSPDLPQTLEELQRIVRPGGHVIVSTPNSEDLSANKSVCPECGCRYHRVQHISSWTTSSLASAMEHIGWETVASRSTLLQPQRLGMRIKSTFASLMNRKWPHLVYVGRKPIAIAEQRSVAAADQPLLRQVKAA